ncbi:MAG: hypothetical protein HY908_10800 [Myxococcales bacterium]|nr:hypothetical protein [Myxococcales bacterium]
MTVARRLRILGRACVACALAAGCEDGSRPPSGTRTTPSSATAMSSAPARPSASAALATSADGGPLDRASAACRSACDREQACDRAGAGTDAELARLVRESSRLCHEQCELEAEMPREELTGVTERREACLGRPCPELEPCLAALRKP